MVPVTLSFTTTMMPRVCNPWPYIQWEIEVWESVLAIHSEKVKCVTAHLSHLLIVTMNQHLRKHMNFLRRNVLRILDMNVIWITVYVEIWVIRLINLVSHPPQTLLQVDNYNFLFICMLASAFLLHQPQIYSLTEIFSIYICRIWIPTMNETAWISPLLGKETLQAGRPREKKYHVWPCSLQILDFSVFLLMVG